MNICIHYVCNHYVYVLCEWLLLFLMQRNLYTSDAHEDRKYVIGDTLSRWEERRVKYMYSTSTLGKTKNLPKLRIFYNEIGIWV